MRLLIIDNDPSVIEIIEMSFAIGWPDVKLSQAGTGQEGLSLFESNPPDAVILDLVLPDTSGFEILKTIRLCSEVPVLILTTKAEEHNLIKALGLGADDYMTKPFRQMELLARIKAITRRTQLMGPDLKICYGPWHFGKTLTELYHGKTLFQLTPTQGLIMQALMKNAGKFVGGDTLAFKIWGEHRPANDDDLRVHIHHIRKKLTDKLTYSKFIINKPGQGYMLLPD